MNTPINDTTNIPNNQNWINPEGSTQSVISDTPAMLSTRIPMTRFVTLDPISTLQTITRDNHRPPIHDYPPQTRGVIQQPMWTRGVMKIDPCFNRWENLLLKTISSFRYALTPSKKTHLKVRHLNISNCKILLKLVFRSAAEKLRTLV